ncbi:hypothetical protein C8Q74DRAFT_1288335 [Fomes fomentarius]|nr:hypothetical protein C8Q74DRAFT_1288335 [Fomes fomentarius]
MAQQQLITLYYSPISHFSDRVLFALEEAKAEYTKYPINLSDKPAWYALKVNPLGKLPAIAYGGPRTSPDDPSPESTKLAESLAIVEFIADIFPSSGILPSDPILRATARRFALYVDIVFVPQFRGFFVEGAPASAFLDALEVLQRFLPERGFVLGEQWSLADIAIAPILLRLVVCLENEIGTYALGVGHTTLEAVKDPRFARIWQYIQDLKERPSIKANFNGDEIVALLQGYPDLARK